MGTSELALLGTTILIPLGLFVMIFGIYYLRNREKMAMIERGIDPTSPKPKRQEINVTSLQFGLLIMGSGIGLFIAYLLDFFVFREESPAIYFALIAIFGGLGLFISYLIERKANQKKSCKNSITNTFPE